VATYSTCSKKSSATPTIAKGGDGLEAVISIYSSGIRQQTVRAMPSISLLSSDATIAERLSR
jgi:hypothetical protein|tara:strand:- start:138678 stop:138863 length:186 start_codon:yes stop_codon:yes gene_type:complete